MKFRGIFRARWIFRLCAADTASAADVPGTDFHAVDILNTTEKCGACSRPPGGYSPVFWSPVFGKWLCSTCLSYLTEAELRATREAFPPGASVP